MKAILLIRVSTVAQDYAAQKNDLINYAITKGYCENDLYVIEDKESAIKLSEEERHGLNELKDVVADDNSYNAVFVWEISRLARTEKVLHSIKEWLLTNKINLYIFDKQYQLLNPDGSVNGDTELLFSLYAYFASQEMKIKKIRFARSKEFNRKQNKYVGGKLCYGYTTDVNKNIIIDKNKVELIRGIFNIYINTDKSMRQIGIDLIERGIISMRTAQSASKFISNIVCNYAYSGDKNSQAKTKNPYTYPQIVPREYIDKAIEKCKNTQLITRTTNNIYYGKGLLKDKESGLTFQSNTTNVTYEITSKRFNHTASGKYHGVDMNLVDSCLWYFTVVHFLPWIETEDNETLKTKIEKQLVVNNEKKAKLLIQLELIQAEVEKVQDFYFKSEITIDRYNFLKKDINKRKNDLDKKLSKVNSSIIELQQELSNLCSNNDDDVLMLSDIYNDLVDDEKRYELIHKYVKEVIVSKDGDYSILEFISKGDMMSETIKIHRRTSVVYYYEGEKEYQDVIPIFERFSSRVNPETNRKLALDYYYKNREERLAKQKEYHQQNKDIRNAKRREYYQQHKLEIAEKRKAKYHENIEESRKKNREIYHRNKKLRQQVK